MELEPIPNRFLPKWARLCGVDQSPMLEYCISIKGKDKLPRGLDDRCGKLIAEVTSAIKGINNTINTRGQGYGKNN